MAVNPAPADFPYTAFSCGSAKGANLGAQKAGGSKAWSFARGANYSTSPAVTLGGGGGGPPSFLIYGS